MSCLPRNMMSISAHDHQDFASMQVVDKECRGRKRTTFYLGTKDDAFGIYGTYDQILDFATAIMQTAMSWPLLNGHTEWLGDPVTDVLPGWDDAVIPASTVSHGNHQAETNGDTDNGGQ
jgi:hypothetical protein